MKAIAFFNNKGGVGKTSLVYHLAWMFADRGLKVCAIDLDPQANLSSIFLSEERLEEIWPEETDHTKSILGSIQPILRGTGDINEPFSEIISEKLHLVVGDLGLSAFEDSLSDAWPRCLDRKESAFRVTSAFSRAIKSAANRQDSDIVLIDVGPNLGAINRASLISADHIVIPLGPDLFSLQGLRNLGPMLRVWRRDWKERYGVNPEPSLDLPKGIMAPEGYVMMRHSVRLNRPVQAYAKWIERMPTEYRRSILREEIISVPEMVSDPHCLAQMKDYRSLMPMAQDANKPMFFLKPADGAIGAQQAAVHECYKDFLNLAKNIAIKIGINFN